MKIAFVGGALDLSDPGHYSGFFFGFVCALREAGHEVVTFPPIKGAPLTCRLRFLRYRLFSQRMYMDFLDLTYAQWVAAQVNERLAPFDGDVVLTNYAGIVPFYEGKPPLVLVTDSMLQCVADCGGYEGYDKLCGRCLMDGRFMHDTAVRRADAVIMPSEWVWKSAVHDHGGSPERMHWIRWGPDLYPASPEAAFQRRPPHSGACRLLFVGKDWKRKGGQVALDTTILLRQQGVEASLTVVGCVPPDDVPACVEIIPFLDKGVDDDRRRLATLFTDSHFLLVPTRADVYGLVFVEAAAFGLPSLSYDHTGVASSVANGISGILLPPNAHADAFAGVVLDLIQDAPRYMALSKSSQHFYGTEANWTSSIRKILACLNDSIESRPAGTTN